jgi:UPF0042 nucleotide-binding protein
LSATDKPARARLVLITGLSGSGKSTVTKCLEDLGYHCVDNLPLPLLRRFLEDPLGMASGDGRIAVVADLRARGFATEFPGLLRDIDRRRIDLTLLFLEASDEALVRRFSETRRPHPLAGDGPAIEGIRRERELLADLRGSADLVLDTSEWSIHETRGIVYREFGAGPGAEPAMVISLVSFGFKFGIPYGTDLLFDVRFLPNPHFVPGLRERTGRELEIQDYLGALPEYGEFMRRLEDFVLYLLPRYRQENRSYLSIAIGCTGGRHRSVAIAEALGERLSAAGWAVRIIHRDIAR